VRSPQSPLSSADITSRDGKADGIAEACVNTLRRRYLHLSILPDVTTVLPLLRARFDNCNNIHTRHCASDRL
jgi:hypothetical protein